MKLFTEWMLAAGLAFSATAAQAQMPAPYDAGRSPYTRASDFGAPYREAPYDRSEAPYERSEAPYDRGAYYAPPLPPEAAAPPRYGYGYGPALLPLHEVYNIIRQAGFSPLGIPQQRGYVYTISVIDRGGDDGKLVIDARNGRIIRFMPAWQMGGHFNGAMNMNDGPAGTPPVTLIRGAPRPPASVPHVASRTVPVPKANPLGSKPAEAAASKPAEAPQQSAAVQTKPAEASPPSVAAATVGQAQPAAAPSIQPTREMPKVQGLE
jgi:hypothetical protein